MSGREYRLTREGWGRALVKLGHENPNVVVLVGDLASSTMVDLFAREFPERFIECGIAEQNMATIAAGLSLVGKIPFFATYGAFASCRAADQLRVAICYSNLNVKIGGAHGGISVGPDGATHQAMEEIAIMRSLPNMKMIIPADYYETFKATGAAAEISGPVYIRFGREKVPVVTDENTPFIFGKANIMRDGGDVAIIACGVMVHEALAAAEDLARSGIEARVINMHTLKPLDEDCIIKAARECGAIVTAEEHQIYGGLGSAVAQVVAREYPVPMDYVAVMDRFGESGKPDELLTAFGLRSGDIIRKVGGVINMKSGRD
ncbi:MAG: transketolase [candidate division Zixibacteria bacterium RBG_16_53_22]|nr:MAG: transketolase [candidate division Zixibacteria bacterium RBG_16_53_22]